MIIGCTIYKEIFGRLSRAKFWFAFNNKMPFSVDVSAIHVTFFQGLFHHLLYQKNLMELIETFSMYISVYKLLFWMFFNLNLLWALSVAKTSNMKSTRIYSKDKENIFVFEELKTSKYSQSTHDNCRKRLIKTQICYLLLSYYYFALRPA